LGLQIELLAPILAVSPFGGLCSPTVDAQTVGMYNEGKWAIPNECRPSEQLFRTEINQIRYLESFSKHHTKVRKLFHIAKWLQL
jgi:hypothetical protein